MSVNNRTWSVFETKIQHLLSHGEQEDIKVLLGDFFATNFGITESRIDFDEQDKTIFRYAVPTNTIKYNEELKQMTQFIASKIDVVENTFPGQMITNPDVTKPCIKTT